ncbi:stage V sporulation protein R [Planifilum fimeticola]|uniref:Stage V sporulation protein R n=1 Tax=Planifilum fimeticola TaxID=201975 RepID=A0A2T0LJP8_9BACL|nr:SpoVR family protein [Planifilum fimeticola]PRX42759.1 stage V sporulation protein R [Planifilum fimeticola]
MQFVDMERLERAIEEITERALASGLDFFPMRYEITPPDILYSIGAYGMPTRFSHWSFGKAYYRMKTDYDYGLSKIYELVINSNPCYAFLLESNSLLQNKLIVAHVLGHSDFFKNNAYFSLTNRNMVESMAVTARRIRAYEEQYGRKTVETFLDAVLSINEHVDPHTVFRDGTPTGYRPQSPEDPGGGEPMGAADSSREEAQAKGSALGPAQSPKEEKDLVRFIADRSPILEGWEREIMYRLREEMLYFWPQLETKIMNEGWATFWHVQILREMDLDEEEAVEFAAMHSRLIQPPVTGINPYLLGWKMFVWLDRNLGREAVFDIRATESDVSFLRNYLNKELAEEMDLFVFRRSGEHWRITSKDVEEVREHLIRSRINGGYPYIVACDDNYQNRGELYLLHRYDGTELDTRYIAKTLPMVYRLWGRPVHLETVISDQNVRYTWDGKKLSHRV